MSEASKKVVMMAASEALLPLDESATKKRYVIAPEEDFTAMANAFRSMKGTEDKFLLEEISTGVVNAAANLSAVTATAGDILQGKVIAGADGQAIEGSMTDNGAISGSIDGLTTTAFTVPAGYTTGGTVTLTDDIETALAAI